MAKRILSVGQCGFDDSQIAAALQKELRATTDHAASAEEAKRMMAATHYDLVLVNRIFDSTGDSGLAFIASIKNAGDSTPIMLVSNYPDAQARAIAHGALPGFGKSSLQTPHTAELLRKALSPATP